MGEKRVTIKDIARELGIDYSTVAYALSGKGRIKEETRQKVRETADRMGYIRNRMASDMRKNNNSTIGLVIPSIVSSYGEFAQHVFRLCYDAGLTLQIAVSEYDAKLETDSLQNFLERGVGGILLKTNYRLWSKVPEKHPLRSAEKNGVTVIHYGSEFRGSPFPAVYANNRKKGVMIGQILRKAGCKTASLLLHQAPPLQQGFIKFAEGILTGLGKDKDSEDVAIVSLKERLPSTLPESKVQVNTHYRDEINEFIEHGGVWAAEQLLDSALKTGKTDALVCQNDLLAIGVIRKAEERGMRIPEDIAVIASDRSFSTQYSPIPLSTVHIPHFDLAKMSIGLMEKAMAGERVQSVRIEPVFTKGETLPRT